MERTQKEMEHDLERVSEHLDEAKAKAPDARVDDGGPLEDVTGDLSGQQGGPMFGEDPEGAIDDRRAQGEG